MINRKDFNRTVREFELKHKKKLASCLASTETSKAFFETPIIHAYLSRKDTQVTFAQRHPQLFDSRNKKEHAKTDHYELAVYKHKPFTIAYRSSCITSPNFYNDFTYDDTANFFNEKLKRINEQSTDINVDSRVLNAHEVANDITLASMQPKTCEPAARFRIYSMTDNEHTTTLLVVMHPTTHQPLIAISLNSSTDDNHFTYIKNCLLQQQKFSHFNSDRNLLNNYFFSLFGVNVDDPSLCKTSDSMLSNERASAVCFVHPTNKDEQLLRQFQVVKSIFSLKQLGYLSAVKGIPEQNRISLIHQPSFPIIYVPHPLQREHENDNNCVLYSMQFIQAIVNLLNNQSIAERVFKCAKAANKNSIRAQDELFNIFSSKLRTYLPFYYNTVTREPKSPLKLREFHLRQRWNIGSESFSMLYSIKSEDKNTTLNF